jgi:hypothetical protein
MPTRYAGTLAGVAFPRAAAIEHVRELAKQHNLVISWVKKWETSTAIQPNRLFIPRPWSGKLYLVALHEIGHFVDPTAKRHWETTRVRDYLVSEAAATGWAIEHIDPGVAEAMLMDDFAYLADGFKGHGRDLVRIRRESLLR